LVSLVGSWSLVRTADNGVSMTGIATVARRGADAFDYHEGGALVLPGGQILAAERRYLFAATENGFAVFFAETPRRLFHRVAVIPVGANLIGDATHLCGDDRYDSRYEFRAVGEFLIAHRVRGPRKRYDMVTRYSRPLRRWQSGARPRSMARILTRRQDDGG